jgi:hypothetical protein
VDMKRWDPRAPIDPAICADLLVLAAEQVRSDVPVAYVLNKADDAKLRGAAEAVAAELQARVSTPTVLITSHPRLMERGTTMEAARGPGRQAHAAT